MESKKEHKKVRSKGTRRSWAGVGVGQGNGRRLAEGLKGRRARKEVVGLVLRVGWDGDG